MSRKTGTITAVYAIKQFFKVCITSVRTEVGVQSQPSIQLNNSSKIKQLKYGKATKLNPYSTGSEPLKKD